MSSKYEQNLSMDELMKRNVPTKNTPIPPPTVLVQCPMQKELTELTANTEWTAEYLKRLTNRTVYPTSAQMDEIIRTLKRIEYLLEQAGKPKEKRFSLPKPQLPRLHLPEWDGPTVATIVMALSALALLWLILFDGWSSLRMLLPW